MKLYTAKMLKGYILIPVFFCCGFGVQAQTKLTGEIADKNGRAIAGVSVDFNHELMRTLSDSDGRFAFTYPDTLTNRSICFRSIGYKTKTMSLNRGQQTLRVILLDSVYSLGTATVSASRNGRFADYSAQTVQMSTFDIVTNPAAMADIIGNMRVLPGVQTNDNDGRLIIQGGSSDESQIYINDLIVANPYSLSAIKNVAVRSRFTPDLFSGVVLRSGGFNAEFGQALSGIVNLNTKAREQMTAKTDIAVSSIYSGLTHIVQKPAYACRASIDYNNIFLAEKISGFAYDAVKPYQSVKSDIFVEGDLSPDTKMTAQFSGSHANSIYMYANADGAGTANHLTQTYLYGQMNFHHAFGDRLSLSAATNLVVDGLSGTGMARNDDALATQNIWNHSKVTLQYRTAKAVNRSGAEFIANPYRETYTLPDGDYRRSAHSNLAAVYSDTKFFLSDKLSVSTGLRGEYKTGMRKWNVAPRLYMAYRADDVHIFSVSAGDYFQLPATDYLKVTDRLDFASVRKATVAYSYVRHESKFQIDAYYKKYSCLVTGSPETGFDNSGYGHGYGADVFLKSSFRSLEYWATYSFNNTRKRYDNFTVAVAPPYVARHSFNLTLKYWIAALKSLPAANGYISSGRPWYADDMRTKAGETPHHSRIDVSWSFLPAQWIVVHFGCQNILGRKNVYGYEYSAASPGRRKTITAAYDRFVFLGVFITLSRSKTLNQLKSL
ncbi:MAG: TonB-dependent receptor [Tannerella sp.]|nr:TonB-dependent receptor [Tannerella sp.]